MFSSCEQERVKPVVKSDLKVTELPAQESWNSKIIFTDSGQTKAIMLTGHLRVFSQAQETLLDSNVRVDFFNRHGLKSTTLTALRGRIDDKNKDLYAYDNVVVTNDSGIVVETTELMWDNKRGKIVTDKFVTITTRTEKIEGFGFESDQFIRNYIIYRITYVTNLSSQ